MNKFKIIIILYSLGCLGKLFAQIDTLKKSKKNDFEFDLLSGVNAFNKVTPNYRNPFWKNVGFFSNFYFSIKAVKNFKIKKNYFIGISANTIYFENYSKYEIGNENDKSYYYKSNYYLNNKLLFIGLHLRKNWQVTKYFNAFTIFSINSNLYSKTKYNGSTVEYSQGNISGYLPYPDITILPQVENDGWFKNKTLKSNLMYSLMFGIKSKFNKTPFCFTFGGGYSRHFSEILMSTYGFLFGVTFDL